MTSPIAPISTAREIGKKHGLRSAIILQELPDGRWGYTSYGATKADCSRAKRIADELLEEYLEQAILWVETVEG